MTGLGSGSICTLRKGSCDWQLFLFITTEPSSLRNVSDLPFSFYSSHSCRRPWSQSNHRGAPGTLDVSADSILVNFELSPLFMLYRKKVKRARPTHLPQEQTVNGWAPRNLVWTPGGLVCHNPKEHRHRGHPSQDRGSPPAQQAAPVQLPVWKLEVVIEVVVNRNRKLAQ